MRISRTKIASFLLALAFAEASATAQQVNSGVKPPMGTAPQKPVGRNVLILVADDMGVEQLELYGIGQDFPHTPRIDELAANGVTFLHAWSNPNCSPTRAGLLTGRHAFRTGVGHVVTAFTEALPQSEYTLPEVLDLGPTDYASGMFGKWHLGSYANGGYLSANQNGWDRFDGSMLGFAGVQSYYDWQRVVDGSGAKCTEYATSVHVDAALEWIATAPEPWICYVPFMAAHLPYEWPPAGLYYENLSGNPTQRQLYKATVEAMDTEIGRLLDGIEQSDAAKPLVIFASDNGTEVGAVVPPVVPGKAKGTLFEGGIHVPLIVSGWDAIPPGSQCDALVQVLDIFDTVADFAGVNARAELPGSTIDSRSLRPLLAAPDGPSIRTHLYSEIFYPPGFVKIWWHNQVVRDQRYKLLVATGIPWSLYDLELDPYENNNLLLGPLAPEQQVAYDGLQSKLAELMASR